jgi:hypothetical protein
MLRLSHIHAPGPRPHHRRIGRAMLDDAANAHGGQVFTCPNGDLVLIDEPDRACIMMADLSRLFRLEAPGTHDLLSLWTLPKEHDAALAALHQQATAPPPTDDPPTPLGAIAAVGVLLASAPFGELVRRQAAIHLTTTGFDALYQELSFSLPALEAQIGLPLPIGADPYLFRHLAARLDERMLEALAGGGLVANSTLHLNLTVAGVLSPEFTRLATAAGSAGTALGVELQLMEVVADLPRFTIARARLQEAGCAVVLDGVDHAALLLADPAALGVEMVKLDWSPRILSLPARERRRLAQVITDMGAERTVLNRAETEPALAWGRSQGIRRFQGRHVDAMLAADRITICPHASGCTLRQCIGRAAATDALGQQGCHNPALLDATTRHQRPASPA